MEDIKYDPRNTNGQQGEQWTKEFEKSYFRQCDKPECQSFALIRDWANWKWCVRHFIRNFRQDEHKWLKLKWARFNFKAFF